MRLNTADVVMWARALDISVVMYQAYMLSSIWIKKRWKLYMVSFGLWFLTPLSTIFQLYRGGQFYLALYDGYYRNVSCALNLISTF